jgi:hypothetical protein
MSTDIGTTCNRSGHTENSTLGIVRGKPETETKEEWLEHHSNNIFRLWQRWQTPLGISLQYLERVKQELSEYYKEPLKQKFIEATYL